jgi:diacylglycerol kinase (ATP)
MSQRSTSSEEKAGEEGIENQLSRLLGGKHSQPEGLNSIRVIVNPAAGKERPILRTLALACKTADVEWEIFVTQETGDGRRLAGQAIQAKVDRVVVYGGDGTVMDVASGLINSSIPLAIIPGGTANVLSLDLGIPKDLVTASALAVDSRADIRSIDIGKIEDRYFLLRAGLGFEADMVAGAERELKDRFGVLAYAISAVQALADPQVANYQISIDGQEVTAQGLTCILANSGLLGVEGLYLAPDIKTDDGLLDVFVVTKADLTSLLSLAASVVEGKENRQALQHWQGREVRVASDPPQQLQVDGELLGITPFTATVMPKAIQVVVPRTDQPREILS